MATGCDRGIPLGLRDAIQKSPAVGVVIAVAVIGLAAWLAVGRDDGRRATPPSGQWFYELSSGRLIVADIAAIPPIQGAEGGESVRARVYGCGSCKESDRKVAILEKYPPKVAEQLTAPLPVDPDSEEAAAFIGQQDQLRVEMLLIAEPPQAPGGEITWVSQDSPQAMAVTEAANALCGESDTQLCLPQ